MKKKPGQYIFLIVPEHGNNLSFTFSSRTLKLLLVLILLFLAALTGFIVYYHKISLRFLMMNDLVEQNRRLREDNSSLQELRQAIGDIRVREEKIRNLARDYYREDRKPDGTAARPAAAPLVTEREIDEFIRQVLKRKNLDYINTRDQAARQKMMVDAMPNILPVDGWITRSFSAADSAEGHPGIDVAAAANTPVKAAADGMVVFAGWAPQLGYTVEINHSYGFKTVYGHNARLLVNRGDLVQRGSIIALSGNTGRSSAPHLHYEVIKNGINQDPILFILR
jgi:murein DD-endopeptidase MepM/ murein hydrolase activator NlpD